MLPPPSPLAARKKKPSPLRHRRLLPLRHRLPLLRLLTLLLLPPPALPLPLLAPLLLPLALLLPRPALPTLPSGAQFVNNVIYNNSRDIPGSQFYIPSTGAGCTFFNTVVPTNESSKAAGLVAGGFDFGDDLRTVTGSGSDANVIDKALPYMNPAGMTEAVPAYDLDGNKRPAGSAADVGATEVKK